MAPEIQSMSAAKTLPDLLRNAAATTQSIIHVGPQGAEREMTYQALYAGAQQVGRALWQRGLRQGDLLLVALERSEDFLLGFWGALLAGIIPVPLANEPARMLKLWAALDRPALLSYSGLAATLAAHCADQGLPWMRQELSGLEAEGNPVLQLGATQLTAADQLIDQADWVAAQPRPDDLAYLQFSSGSTGDPRGVELTHAALLANLRQMLAACPIFADDVALTWMPYYHDMGLIMTHFVPLAAGIKQVKLGALHFARRPALWLELAQRHQATLLTAAPFALALVLRRVPASQISGLDLRAVRLLAVGAEPIGPSICRDFLAFLAPAGLAPEALTPVYGLAESAVGVTLSPPGTGMRSYLLDRAVLVGSGKVVETQPGPQALELVDLGRPLPGCAVRIVDDQDQPLGDDHIGHIQIGGPQLMRGYYRDPDPAASFCAGWLRSGDLGFLRAGRLVVTGRAKDVIIVNGHKHHAADLEALVRGVAELQLRHVAVCGSYDPQIGEERILIFVALSRGARSGWEHALPALREVVRLVREATSANLIEIIPLAARRFPHTTSGKLQRYRLRLDYVAGEFAELSQAIQRRLAEIAQPAASQPGSEALGELEQELLAICSQVLKIDPAAIHADASLFDYGATSLQLMELLAAIGEHFGVEPDPAVLRERPTLAGVADWLQTTRSAPSIPEAAGSAPGPIAVIGMACRLPGADSPEQFWANLVAGVDSVGPIPPQRRDGIAAPAGASWGSLLDEVARFDASFFGIDPAEAATMDPQQRILLELAYEALERAGYAGDRRTRRRVGVFIGVGESGYQELLLARLGLGATLHPSTATGNMRNLVAGRIAHTLDLTGPAIALDTACSSALVALHMACVSLRQAECDLALVGGISLNLTGTPYLLLDQAGVLSPTGRCQAFDDAAAGIGLGEGAGMLVLEALDQAELAGDQVLGLIRGSAINNDGHSLSPMAPNPVRQAEVLRRAYQQAGIDPATVSYLEAHGTGTALGDSTEIRSLASVFPADGPARVLGAVKTNIGHLLNAAGMPALIKVLLMLQHRQIPASLHYTTPNRRFDLARAGLIFNTELRSWDGPLPLRAGINGFGFGGTNAHIILEQPPARLIAPADAQDTEQPFQLLTLSARTPAALGTLAGLLADHLRANPAQQPAEICASANQRAAFEQRAMLVIGAPDQASSAALSSAAQVLEALAHGTTSPAITSGSLRPGRRRKVAFLFAGQGTQYPQQGQRLHQAEERFRTVFAAASQSVGPVNGRRLEEWCFNQNVSAAELGHTAVTQPLLVAFEIALARLVMSWGLRPDVVIGHSVGELAAACVAGSLSFADTLALARERGRLMAELAEPGIMAAVFAPEAVVRAALARQPGGPVIAAINATNQIVISGAAGAVEQVLELLASDGFSAIPVNSTYALHSPLMERAVQPIANLAATFHATPPLIPLLSTVNGEWVKGTLAASYWAEQVVRPVLFAPAIERLIEEGVDTFVEIGPGSTLAALVLQILAGRELDCPVEALLRRGADDRHTIRAAAGRLWVWGVALDRPALDSRTQRQVVLPTYPFAHERHWLADQPVASLAPLAQGGPLRATVDQSIILNGQAVADVLLTPNGDGWQLQLSAANGQPVATLDGLRFDQLDAQPPAAQLLHEVVWIPCSLPEAAPAPLRHWLIIAEEHDALAGELGSRLQAKNDQWAVIHPAALEQALDLPFADQRYGVVYLASSGAAQAITRLEELEGRQRSGVLRLHRLIQRLLMAPTTAQPASLWVLTTGACATGSDHEDLVPEQALIAGLVSALPDQRIGFPCLALDLAGAALIDLLLSELAARPVSGVIAWRAGQRLTRSLVPLDQRAGWPDLRVLTPAPGAILIAGGAGGVGAALARHLAGQRQAALVLIGRSPLDSRRSRLISELVEQGAPAVYYQADITDQRQVERLISACVAEYGAVAGIIQATSVLDPGSLQAKSSQQFAAVLAPKVRGTWLLARELSRQSQRPDFFITCSSIAAVLPGFGGGLADYVAANSFLDTFAAAERRAGRSMTALNWSAWAEVGMAASPFLLGRLESAGLAPLLTAQALHAFDQALAAPAAQLAVFAPAARQPITRPAASPPPPSHSPAAPMRPLAALGTSLSAIEQELQALIASTLRLPPDRVALDGSFLALGLDSLQAVDLVKRLEQTMHVTLPLTLFFEFQTIRDLAPHLASLAPGLAEQAAPALADVARAAAPAPFGLTPPQLDFYVGQQLYPERPAFALLRQKLAGPLDPQQLKAAFELVIERHPLLRVQFEPVSSEQPEPQQRIVPIDRLHSDDWFEYREVAGDLDALEQALIAQHFDLHQAPLFRLVLCRISTESWEILLLVHHAIADGWSLSILAEDCWTIYTQISQGQPPQPSGPVGSFSDYRLALEEQRTSAQASSDRAWWSALFRQHATALTWTLPTAQPPAAQATGPLRVVRDEIDPATSQQIRQRAAAAGVSPFHLLVATYARRLGIWSNAPAIAINVAESGRGLRLPGIERLVGCCAEHVPLLVDLARAEEIDSLAVRVRDSWVATQQHRAISARDLAHLRPQRPTGLPGFSFASFPRLHPAGCPVQFESISATTGSAITQLTLLISEIEGGLDCAWIYQAGPLQRETVLALAAAYRQDLLSAQPPAPAPLANPPHSESPADLLVIEQILAQCARHPQAQALSEAGTELSYGDLALESEQLATQLIDCGAERNQPVGLLTLPGRASVVGMVAILRSAAPWLALNSEYPRHQLDLLLKQAGVRRLIYQPETAALARQLAAECDHHLQLICIDQEKYTDSRPEFPAAGPDDLAYIIFTSGSTGVPNGVPITQRALANYLGWLTATFGYGPGDRLLQTAALSFDAAISQILGPLVSGATIIPVARAVLRDPESLLDLIEQEQPTIWRSVPALWERLLAVIERRIAAGQAAPALNRLRLIGVGGEPLPASYVRRWMAIYGDLHQIANHYGPSEATINATCYTITARPAEDATHIPIGRAIQGVVTRILAPDGQPCPPLTSGELWLGGVCLTPGYLGRPDLTAERFADDPAGPDGRLYRTGDLVRELADGNLEFIGRVDDQIKLRGYRIEPAEIEAALHQHPAIARAIVGLSADRQQLVAYLETQGELPAAAELRRWLIDRLPPQMIPHQFQIVAALPLTPTGKVDRRQLAGLVALTPAASPAQNGSAPGTPTERLLAEIWQAVLGLPDLSRHADFFELGGDSLLSLQVFARLEGRVPALPRAATLYEQRTIAAQACAIDAAAQAAPPAQPSAVRPDHDQQADFALSPAQAGFLLAEALDPGLPTSWCARLQVAGPLDLGVLEQALALLVARHPMLRVVFPANRRPPRQIELAADQPIRISFDDLTPALGAGADPEPLIDQCWREEQAQPFALDRWPLLRMRVLRLAPDRHIWLLATHHIIGDGWSSWIFGQDLLRIYDRLISAEPANLPALRSTFREYVALLEHHTASNLALHEAYWRSMFADPYQPPVCTASGGQSGAQAAPRLTLELDALRLGQLRRVAVRERITLYGLLLALFARQLRRLTAAADLVIGTALSGRDLPLPDLDRLVGCFATALPVRLTGTPANLLAELRQVQHAFSAAYLHALPPAQIARLLPPQTALLSAVGAQFFFTFLDFDALGPLASANLTIDWPESATQIQAPSSQTDLLLAVRSAGGALRLSFQAAARSFSAADLQQCADGLLADLAELIGELDQAAQAAEQQRIVFSAVELHQLPPARLDAALIGYLPPSQSLAALLGGSGSAQMIREHLRSLLFPGRQPQWFEALQTPLGRSGLICLPWFAEELATAPAAQLMRDIVAGVEYAGELGAGCVSLAGMLPALTGYGFGVLHALDQAPAPRLTTGHATTAVAVVLTVEAALSATNTGLAESDLALVGFGSIGRATLALLLNKLPHPQHLVICDAAGSYQRVSQLAQELCQAAGYRGLLEIVEAGPEVPPPVYQARLIIAATSSPKSIEVARLRPGTIVVDDSFPACLDIPAAIQRMRQVGDVLVVGGGLLEFGPGQRTIYLPIQDARLRASLQAGVPAAATASCQLESLLQAADPTLPLTHGLVELANALRYWQAAAAAGFGAAPLHLQDYQPDPGLLAGFQRSSHADTPAD